MDACTIDDDKAPPQAILLHFRSEGRASFHYSKLVMIQLCPSCKLHTVSRLISLLANKKVLNNILYNWKEETNEVNKRKRNNVSTAAATISLGPSKGDN
jgi:hypothetical protein